MNSKSPRIKSITTRNPTAEPEETALGAHRICLEGFGVYLVVWDWVAALTGNAQKDDPWLSSTVKWRNDAAMPGH